MRANMGTTDRVIRSLVAVAIVILYLMHLISGTLAIVLGVIAVVFLATSFVSFCPGYLPFGFSTRKREPGTGGA